MNIESNPAVKMFGCDKFAERSLVMIENKGRLKPANIPAQAALKIAAVNIDFYSDGLRPPISESKGRRSESAATAKAVSMVGMFYLSLLQWKRSHGPSA